MKASTSPRRPGAVVIGAGPAGLMAATELAGAGFGVTIAEAMPSAGRKFLMAGKSGLNLTRQQPMQDFLSAYHEAAPVLRPVIEAFGPEAVQNWARRLGQDLFTGSTGRVFPKVMKASPLLRAWLGQLDGLGVTLRTRWRWVGWEDEQPVFETPTGCQTLPADAVVLALGGASWKRLGSDGTWSQILAARGINLAPFAPANAGICVEWSAYMARHFGHPLKGIALSAGAMTSRGEAIISERGLEGGGVYAVSRAIREGHDLTIDLAPDRSSEDIAARIARPQGKASWTNHLRKALRLNPTRVALLQEFARPLPRQAPEMAALIKALPVRHSGLRPIDEAISTAGGVRMDALDDRFMLTALPGVFCAGEMLDWEAPTGGYLLTASLATGRWAGRSAANYLRCNTVTGDPQVQEPNTD